MENIVIKAAIPEDVPQLLALIKELAEHEQALAKVQATEELLRVALFGPKANAEAVLVWLNNTAIAFAVFFHNFSTYVGRKGLYLEDIYVKPEFRGFGIGKKILGYLAEIALERNCGRMEWSVLNWNQTAIDFYETTPATALGDRIIYRVTETQFSELIPPNKTN